MKPVFYVNGKNGLVLRFIVSTPSHEMLCVCGDNEDADGRSVGERLCTEGVAEPTHDPMLAAAAKSSFQGN
jgi:hypothetical protein